MTIHIIGGAGFIGVEIVRLLKLQSSEHFSVIDLAHRLDRSAQHLSGVETFSVTSYSDPAIFSLFRPNDKLVHLGWSSQPANSMTHYSKDATENVIGSIDLFSTAIHAGVTKIVFASSGGTVYGNTDKDLITEAQPLAPVSAYGAAKASVECYLQMLASTHRICGISARIGNPFGAYQLEGTPIGVVANFIRQSLKGESIRVFGDGTKVRDYLAVSDVARAVSLILEAELESGAYNVGSGKGVSVNQVIKKLDRFLPVKKDIKYVEDRTFDAQKIVLDCEKLKRATGWVIEKSFDQALLEMLQAPRY